MGLCQLPQNILHKFDIYERNHAIAILSTDFPDEFQEIINTLNDFIIEKSDITAPGGSKSKISKKLDSSLYKLGWTEKLFNITISIDSKEYYTPSHKIDCCKNRIGLEIEWNNKDPFYDRDLSNFRLLHDVDALSVGVIITRSDELQETFNSLGKGSSYGASTTHFGKLKPRIDGRGAGGCPILVFAIKNTCIID